MAQGFSLKDHLFNADTVGGLARRFGAAGVFDPAPFQAEVMAELPALELKARITLIAQVLARHLPRAFPQAVQAIRAALPPPLDPTLRDDDFGEFIYAPLGVYVEDHGLSDHFDLSLDLIEDLTQRFSMEFSLRSCLNHDPAATLARLRDWAGHPHYHVRRLVSEGTRPRLPWGQSVPLTPGDTLPLLDLLHADPTRYVIRSVANHLNDLTRTTPDAVLAHLTAWRDAGRQDAGERDWMARHALRNLVKAGHPGALAHLGYDPDLDLTAQVSITPQDLPIGASACITAQITPAADAPLLVDYVIDFVKANGTSAPRVFKLKTLTARAGKTVTLTKTHAFKKGATTFTHYPGAHGLRLQVNGRIVAETRFALS